MAKRKKPEDKEKELLEKRLLKIQFYESLTSIVVAIVTMLLAVVTAILNWIKSIEPNSSLVAGER